MKPPRPSKSRRGTLYSLSETALLSKKRSPDERRVFERHEVGFPVRLENQDGDFLGVCTNYSRRGLLFLAPHRMHLGSRIQVELPLGGTGSASIWLEVLLMRIKCDPTHPLFKFPTAAMIKSHMPALVHEAVLRAHRRAA